MSTDSPLKDTVITDFSGSLAIAPNGDVTALITASAAEIRFTETFSVMNAAITISVVHMAGVQTNAPALRLVFTGGVVNSGRADDFYGGTGDTPFEGSAEGWLETGSASNGGEVSGYMALRITSAWNPITHVPFLRCPSFTGSAWYNMVPSGLTLQGEGKVDFRLVTTIELPVASLPIELPIDDGVPGVFMRDGATIFAMTELPENLRSSITQRTYAREGAPVTDGSGIQTIHRKQLDGSWAPALPFEDGELAEGVTLVEEEYFPSLPWVQIQLDLHGVNLTLGVKLRTGLTFPNGLPDMTMALDYSTNSTGEPVDFLLNGQTAWGPIADFDWLDAACGVAPGENPTLGGQLTFSKNEWTGSVDVDLIVGPGEAIAGDAFIPTACSYSATLIDFVGWKWFATRSWYGDTGTRRLARNSADVGHAGRRRLKPKGGKDGSTSFRPRSGNEDYEDGSYDVGVRFRLDGDIDILSGLGSSSRSETTAFVLHSAVELSWFGAAEDAGETSGDTGAIEIEMSHEGGFVLDIVPDEFKEFLRTPNLVGKLKVQSEVAPYLDFLAFVRADQPVDLWPDLLTLIDPNDDPDENPRGPSIGVRIVQCYVSCAAARAQVAQEDSERGVASQLKGGPEILNCLDTGILSTSGDYSFVEATAQDRRRLTARENGGWQLTNASDAKDRHLIAPSAAGWRAYMNVTADEAPPQLVVKGAKPTFARVDGDRRQLQSDNVEAEDECYEKPQFLPFYLTKICLDLGKDPLCGTFQIFAILSKREKTFVMTGSLTGGDLKPLWFLPGGLADMVIIEANEVTPLEVSMELELAQTPKRVVFTIAASALINLFDFNLNLTCRIYGIIEHSPRKTKFAIEASIPSESLSFLPSKLKPPYPPSLFISNTQCEPGKGDCLVVPVAALGDKLRELRGGVELFWAGESFVPAICKGLITFQLSIPSKLEILVAATCTLNNVVIPFPAFIKDINFLQINNIVLVAWLKKPLQLSFGLQSELMLSTGSSTCEAKANDGSPAEAECLVTELTSELSISPFEVGVAFEAATEGAWIDPLGLKNFAIVDPHFAIGIGFMVTCPTGICPTLGELGFSVTILWKRPMQTEWPAELRRKIDESGNKVDWPPDFLEHPGILTFTIGMYFAKPPHIDQTLSTILPFAPMFCAKLQISLISPSDIFNMIYDVAKSMVVVYNDIVSALGGEGLEVELPPLDFAMVDEILPFQFRLEAELSTSTVNVFTGPRIFLDFAAFANLFGFDISFQFVFNVSPDLETLFTDPLQLMRETGLFITADTVLPFDIGAMHFAGTVSPALFYLNASTHLALFGVEFDVFFYFEWDVVERTVVLGFGGSLILG